MSNAGMSGVGTMEPREIVVGDVPIPEHEIRLEAQYHPARSFPEAEHQARRALVVKQLLLGECRKRALLPNDAREDQQQTAIDELVAEAVPVPEVTREECHAYYAAHPERFRGPDLYEAAHILIAAPVDDAARLAEATRLAETLIRELTDDPHRFERLARSHSGCPSATQGGNLGQATRGAMVRELEAVLERLSPGELATEPVRTRFGVHVVKLLERGRGQVTPFEKVLPRIQIYLRDAAWRQALSRFIRSLADATEIRGYDFQEPVPEAPRVVRRVRLPMMAGGAPAGTPSTAAASAPVSAPARAFRVL